MTAKFWFIQKQNGTEEEITSLAVSVFSMSLTRSVSEWLITMMIITRDTPWNWATKTFSNKALDAWASKALSNKALEQQNTWAAKPSSNTVEQAVAVKAVESFFSCQSVTLCMPGTHQSSLNKSRNWLSVRQQLNMVFGLTPTTNFLFPWQSEGKGRDERSTSTYLCLCCHMDIKRRDASLGGCQKLLWVIFFSPLWFIF